MNSLRRLIVLVNTLTVKSLFTLSLTNGKKCNIRVSMSECLQLRPQVHVGLGNFINVKQTIPFQASSILIK